MAPPKILCFCAFTGSQESQLLLTDSLMGPEPQTVESLWFRPIPFLLAVFFAFVYCAGFQWCLVRLGWESSLEECWTPFHI